MRGTLKTRVFLALAVCFTACGDDDGAADAALPDSAVVDAAPDTGVDAGSVDVGPVDAGPVDAASDTAVDVGAMDAGSLDSGDDASMDAATDAGPLGMSCDDECAMTELEARFGDVTESFDAAYFGTNGDGTLRVEAYGGAAEGCPEMDSPTPDRTLIIAALPMPTDRSEVVVTATLLDFEGTLTSEPFVSTPTALIRAQAAQLAPLDMAFVRITFDASFEGGEVDGVIYATHCASLDE